MIFGPFLIPPIQDKLRDGYGDGHIIIQTGCLSAMESWFNKNLYYIGGAAIGVAIIQVIHNLHLEEAFIDLFKPAGYSLTSTDLTDK